MTDEDGCKVAAKYDEIDTFVKQILGSPLTVAFMTLSCMALLVIPELKLSDRSFLTVKPLHLPICEYERTNYRFAYANFYFDLRCESGG